MTVRTAKTLPTMMIMIRLGYVIASFLVLFQGLPSNIVGVVMAGSPSPFECRTDYDCNNDSVGDTNEMKRDCIFVFDNDIKNASYCSATALHDTLSGTMFSCQSDDDCMYGNCIFTRDSETNRTIASTCFCNQGFMGANCQNRCTAKCMNGGQCKAYLPNSTNTAGTSLELPGFTSNMTSTEANASGLLGLVDTSSGTTSTASSLTEEVDAKLYRIHCDCPVGYHGFLCEIDENAQPDGGMSTAGTAVLSTLSGAVIFIVTVAGALFILWKRKRAMLLRRNGDIEITKSTSTAGSSNSSGSSATLESFTASLSSFTASLRQSFEARRASWNTNNNNTSNEGKVVTGETSKTSASSLSLQQVSSSIAEARAKRQEKSHQRRIEREHVMASRAAAAEAERIADLLDGDAFEVTNVRSKGSPTKMILKMKHVPSSPTNNSTDGRGNGGSPPSGKSNSSSGRYSRVAAALIPTRSTSAAALAQQQNSGGGRSSSSRGGSTGSSKPPKSNRPPTSSSSSSIGSSSSTTSSYMEKITRTSKSYRSGSTPPPPVATTSSGSSVTSNGSGRSSSSNNANKKKSTSSLISPSWVSSPTTSSFTEWSTSDDGFDVYNINQHRSDIV